MRVHIEVQTLGGRWELCKDGPVTVKDESFRMNEILIKMLNDPEGVVINPGDQIHLTVLED